MNFKEMCRTCLRSGEMMSSIFDEEIEPAKHTAAELLAIFTSIQVDKEDDFPHNICDNCLKEIQQSYLFDFKCKKSEIILHQLREVRVNLKKLKEIPKQNDIVSEVAGELESILKEDFKLEDFMNLCDRNIVVSESAAIERIRSVGEENPNATDKLNFEIVEEECTRDFQLALKIEHVYSDHLMKYNKNAKDVERIQIVSNFQIVEDDCYPQITLKQDPDHNILTIRTNPAQNELELNQNSSNIEILDECASEYQGVFNTERNQNNLIIKGNQNEEEFSEISSNFQVAEEDCVQDFHVTFKSEPELDIGIDCYDEQLKCSACLKQFQSLDTFRGHIVSDHLEENICKLCNEEFECSQFEHSAKHLPFSHLVSIEPTNPSDTNEESIRQTENAQMTAIHKDEYRSVNHMCTHPGENTLNCELCLEKSGNSALLCHRRSKGRDELISNDKQVPHFQCGVCSKIFSKKSLLRRHMPVHTGEKPFQCELCPAKFGHSNTLLCHRRTKHTDELISKDELVPHFQCSVCTKIFSKKCLLRRHMPVHTGERPFQCELCPAKFGHSNTLLCHKRTKHTDQLITKDKSVPGLQCSICNKVCGRKYKLKEHMRVHTGEKPFQCESCPEKFGNSTSLLCHRRVKHADEFISASKPVPDFQCAICYKVFGMKCLLKSHMRAHTGEKPFDCELCPEKFRDKTALLCHRRVKHTDELISDDKPVPDFQCNVCNKVFGQKYKLINHMHVHTGEKPFNCDLCPAKFSHSKTLLRHKRTKHADELISDDKPVPDFQCNVCNKVFGVKFQLKNHMRVHTGEKPLQCKLCPEKFRNSNTLLYHRRTKHKDELISDKPVPDFPCSVCNKVFSLKFQLKNHMHSHTGEKPFGCKLCPEKFGSSRALLSHRRTKHTDEFISDDKPLPDFQCSICYKVFGVKCKLKQHMRVHTREKPLDCELCSKKFRNSKSLLYHRRTKHTNEFSSDAKTVPDLQCSVCSKIFGRKNRLENHMRLHTGEKPFQCKFCPEKFGNSRVLLYHKRTKHSDEFISDSDTQCSICSKSFGQKSLLRYHMRMHVGENPFQCKLCPENFKKRETLLCHTRTKHTDEVMNDDKPEAKLLVQ